MPPFAPQQIFVHTGCVDGLTPLLPAHSLAHETTVVGNSARGQHVVLLAQVPPFAARASLPYSSSASRSSRVMAAGLPRFAQRRLGERRLRSCSARIRSSTVSFATSR